MQREQLWQPARFEHFSLESVKTPVSKEMRTKRTLKRRAKPGFGNEWLRVVECLDDLMAKRVSHKSTKTNKPEIHKDALTAVNAAYAATLRYYTALTQGGKRDPQAQQLISRLWQMAGTRMRKYDPAIATRLKASNPFWSNDATWEMETIQKTWTHLNSIRVNANKLDPDLRSPFSTS